MNNSDTNQVEQLNETAVKCRFFAQYYGVRVFQNEANKPHNLPNYSYPLTIEKNFTHSLYEFLELKPISKITNEDAISMYRGLGRNYESANQFLEDYKSIGFLEQGEVDFLRSNGYAVPFMNYSVDDLVSFGWVRLV